MSHEFNAEEYWADKPKKAWVVRLEAGSRKKIQKHTFYVSARDRDGAIRTAAANASMFLHGAPRLLYVHLATPDDLGCVYTGGAA